MRVFRKPHCLLILLLFCLLRPEQNFAQGYQEKSGDDLMERLGYYGAIRHYQKAYRKSGDLDVLSKIALCYWQSKQYDSAAACYTRLVRQGVKDSTTLLRYAQCQLAQGKYPSAKSSIKEYLRTYPLTTKAKVLLQSCDEEKALTDNTPSIAVENVNFNTGYDEFSPVLQQDWLLYCASGTKKWMHQAYSFDGKPFIDLYSVRKDLAGRFRAPEKIAGAVNTPLHEGPACTMGNQLYFTRNTAVQTVRGEVYVLKMYSAEWKTDEWKDVRPFEHNDPHHSTGHPTIAPNGEWLVFVSDKPGGEGGTDLYACRKNGPSWSSPINLGTEVNTYGQEMFPVFANDSTLYFASDGMPGLGGLDLFQVSWQNGRCGKAQNLGKPFNSTRDDFGLTFLHYPGEGYFSSNRPGGKGGDDIYHFKKIVVNLTINVLDSLTKAPIERARIRIADSLNASLDLFTDRDGYSNLNLLGNQQYNFIISKDSTITRYRHFSTVGIHRDKDTTLTVLLSRGNSYRLSGVVKEKESQRPLPGVLTKLKDIQGNTVVATATDQEGRYNFDLDRNRAYRLDIRDDDHFTSKDTVRTAALPQPIRVNTLLTPIVLNKPIEIENIYYDLDKYDLRPASVVVLDTVYHLMLDNPGIFLEVSSHTDARGTRTYNIELAARRAREVINHLVSKGIDIHRLTYKVYGEEKLATPCPDGTTCPEEWQQLNRRTEFRVIAY